MCIIFESINLNIPAAELDRFILVEYEWLSVNSKLPAEL